MMQTEFSLLKLSTIPNVSLILGKFGCIFQIWLLKNPATFKNGTNINKGRAVVPD